MKLKIQTLTGQTFQIELEDHATVKNVKVCMAHSVCDWVIIKQDNRNFQIFPSTCCPCLQTKHYEGQALLLLHLIGQGSSCMDKM